MIKKRMIDANALPYENQVLSCDDEWCLKVSDIENAPTVDAVEVVRCKDCEHFVRNSKVNTDRGDCYRYGIGCLRAKKIDDFCSYGERKDNDRQRKTDCVAEGR